MNTSFATSIITCPHCKASEKLKISNESSQRFYRCPSCSGILKIQSGDCCILCSFGTIGCLSSEQNLAA